jgi:SAM-dependent methyltransferase
LAVSDFMSQEGRYEGFDIDRELVQWCIHAFANKANFRFQCFDVASQRYNPKGSIQPQDFQFPYASESMDCVSVASVLTHIFPPELENYMSEICRVLKPGGRAWLTAYILDAEARSVEAQDPKRFPFPQPYGVHRVRFQDLPEAGICYDEEFFYQTLGRSGLTVIETFRGSWTGRSPDPAIGRLTNQDILVVRPRPGRRGPSVRPAAV